MLYDELLLYTNYYCLNVNCNHCEQFSIKCILDKFHLLIEKVSEGEVTCYRPGLKYFIPVLQLLVENKFI